MNKKLPSIIQAEQSLSELLAFKQLLKAAPKTPELQDLIGTIEQIESLANELFQIPAMFPEFNTHFNSLGWYAHDFMSVETVKSANNYAQASDFTSAENFLVDYYVKNFDVYLTLLRGLPTYFEREHIIEKAKERFLAEDYISCVPLVLMLADGMSNDVLNKGAFTEGVDLDVWDCLASQNKDILTFIKIITKARRKLVTSKISIPYRNGILHGLDVGYNNKVVAVKTWALLFTIREILIRKKNEPSEKAKFEAEQQAKFNDLILFIKNPIEHIKASIQNAESFYNWKPIRTTEQWKCIPMTGELSNYEKNTPEFCIVSFLFAWKVKNYGLMSCLVQRDTTLSEKKLAGDFRNALIRKQLQSFHINFVQEERGGIVFGITLLLIDENATSWEQELFFIVNNYIGDNLNLNPEASGEWKLHNSIIPLLCYSLSKK
jgi:hypothetical protein